MPRLVSVRELKFKFSYEHPRPFCMGALCSPPSRFMITPHLKIHYIYMKMFHIIKPLFVGCH